MVAGLLGRKLGMTQVFDDAGRVVPVTLIEAGPCTVLQVRTPQCDGYGAVQLGFADRPRKTATQPHRGHVAKANAEPKRFVREIRQDDVEPFKLGQQVTVTVFAEVGRVDVTGTSKGRGFQGGMRRHGFHGKEASHGAKKNHRSLGSTGSSATPSRVVKGTKMAGQMGAAKRTATFLEVVVVDETKNLLAVRGSVPGANGGFLVIRESKKVAKPKEESQ